jgi:hypothetical protein
VGGRAGEGQRGLSVAMVKKKSSPKTKAAVKKKPRTRAKAKPSETGAVDFAATFAKLREVMSAFAPQLRVTVDEPHKYYVVTQSNSWRGGPMYFGAVMQGKAYVSYHLMPLYMCPELVKAVSPALKKRMQGKACFNFRAPDDALFVELSELSQLGLNKYKSKKWL